MVVFQSLIMIFTEQYAEVKTSEHINMYTTHILRVQINKCVVDSETSCIYIELRRGRSLRGC